MCSLSAIPGPVRPARRWSAGFALLDRPEAQVLAVEFSQVESHQGHGAVVGTLAQTCEHREAIVVADHRLAVDQARARATPRRRRQSADSGRSSHSRDRESRGHRFWGSLRTGWLNFWPASSILQGAR